MSKNEERVYKVFVDFDGTITTTDVGEAMFLEFGDPKEADNIIKEWIDGKITSIESWHRLCATVENFNDEEFEKFLNEIELDRDFKEFVQYCDRNNIEIRVLSDGLDYYIKRILEKENLDHLEVYSNKLTFDEKNNLIPQFPFTDEECIQCANCKRNHIIANSADEDYTIYIGDGWSDTCPAQYCDFIFAKRSLLKYCEKNRISYFPFVRFKDVIKRMEELRNKKRLKKRHQAELKRREVYLQG